MKAQVLNFKVDFIKTPCSIESEKTLLGGLLLDCSLFEKVNEKVCPADFFDPAHRMIFSEMITLARKYNTFDAAMLIDCMGLNGDQAKFIYELACDCPSVKNLLAYADIIREKSVQRELISVARNIKSCEDRDEKRKEILASYLEETAAELRSLTPCSQYIASLITEMNLALVRYHDELESKEEPCH